MSEFDNVLEDLDKHEEKNIELSTEEKQRILDNAIKKISETKRKPRYFKKRFLISAAVVILCFGAVAVAAVFKLNPEFLIHFQPKNENDIPMMGSNLAASCEKDGMKLTAEQVIGDDYGFYVLMNLSGENASSYTFNDIEVEVDGSKVVQCSDIIQMGCKDENTSAFMIHIITDSEVIGKKISISCKDIGENVFDAEKQEYAFDTYKKGNWGLSWNLNYASTAKSIDANKEVSVFDGKAIWDKVSISPVSLTVFLTEKERYDEHSLNPNDTIIVQLKDGTRFRSDYADDSDVFNNVDTISLYFDKIIDFNDIESVYFAGEGVQVNENDAPVNRIDYVNPSVGVKISMTEKLKNTVCNKIENSGTDSDLSVKYKSVQFEGEINGVKNMLFEVVSYEGEYSKKQLELLKPMDLYLTNKNGSTYTIRFGEPETEEAIVAFAEIMNDDVAKIKNWIEILD